MAFSDPQQILEKFGLQEGSKVADMGAGSGFYTIEAAKRVGDTGTVYAIEIQEDLLVRLRGELSKSHISNVQLIHGNMEASKGTKIADNGVDAAFVCNVLFQVEKRDDFLNEVKRILKPGGRVLLVDWTDSFGGMGPQPQFVFSLPDARELFKKHGFTEIGLIPAGDHHYGLSFRKDA